MNARAYVDHDYFRRGIRVAVAPREGQLLTWQERTVVDEQEAVEPPANAWLTLTEDEARALYEALAQFYGGNAVDVRHLRKDYEAERARVDRLIEIANRPPVVMTEGVVTQ